MALILSIVSFGSGWYADNVLIPRYCEDVPETLRLLEEVLTMERPAGDGSRIPYLIAAKITYLQPQQSSETIPEYLQRVQLYLDQHCNGAPDSL
ncbi:MAG: hypothetical protein ACE5OQ_00860 [Woeseia sp.]